MSDNAHQSSQIPDPSLPDTHSHLPARRRLRHRGDLRPRRLHPGGRFPGAGHQHRVAASQKATQKAPQKASHKHAQHAHQDGATSWLLAANPTAKRVDIADARTGRITGSLTNIQLGTHAGTIQLCGGRVALMDESKPQLDIVRIDAKGRPAVEQSYRIPSLAGHWERAAWMATDTGRRYIAVRSDFDGSTVQQVTLIDRVQHKARTVKIPISQVATPYGMGTEEMEVFLVGSPLRLVVSAGGRFDAYRLSPMLNGAAPKIDSRTPLSGFPHGPIVNNQGTAIGSDVAVGVQTVKINRHGFGPATFSLYPLPSVQSYRPLMAPDGTTAVGTQAGASAPSTAADKKPALLTTSSTRSGAISSVNLGTGTFTRAVATRDYAAAVVSSGSGDKLIMVDRAARTGLFNGNKEVTSLPKAPTTTARFLAGSPDGKALFLGRSGSRTATVVKPGVRRTQTSQITLPAALPDSLYLTTVSPDTKPYDLIGR